MAKMARTGQKKYSVNGEMLKQILDKNDWNTTILVDKIEKHLNEKYDSTTIDKIINGKTKHPRLGTLNAIIKVLTKEFEYTEDEVIKLIKYEGVEPPPQYYTDLKNLYPDKFEELVKYWIDSKVIEYDKFRSPEEKKNEPVNIIDAVTKSLSENFNVVLYGESGLGKSFCCLKLIESIHNNSDDITVPLFVKLPIIDGSVENTLQKKINNYSLREKKLIIFFDGLNEVGDYNEQQKVLLQINDHVSRNSKHRIIITTQVLNDPIKNLRNYKFFSIQPFSSEDIIEYLGKFKDKFRSDKEAVEFYLEFEEYIKEFISVPKFLDILVTLYEREKHLKINCPIQLFAEYEEFLCGGRNDRIEMDEGIRKYFIPFLAFEMSKNLQSKISSDQFHNIINDFNTDTTFPTINYIDIRESLIKNYHVLKKNENNEYEFNHDLIREYYTGKFWIIKNYDIDSIMNGVYLGSRNMFLLKSLKFFIGFVDENNSKALIKEILKKDLFGSCELFVWSAIDVFDEELIEPISINLNHYLYRTNLRSEQISQTILYYLKILDILSKEHETNLILIAKYQIELGSCYLNLFDNRAEKFFLGAKKALENNDEEIVNYLLCELNLGIIAKIESNSERSIKCFSHVIGLYEKYDLEQPKLLAKTFMELSDVLVEQNPDDAIIYSEKAIELYHENNLDKDTILIRCEVHLGQSYLVKKEAEKSIYYLLKGYNEAKKDNKLFSFPHWQSVISLGSAFIMIDEYDIAILFFEKAINVFNEMGANSNPTRMRIYADMGYCFESIKNYKEAIKYYKMAIKEFDSYFMSGFSRPDEKKYQYLYFECHSDIGMIYFQSKDYSECIPYLEKTILYKKDTPEKNPFIIKSLTMLGECFENLSKLNDAITFYKKSIRLMEMRKNDSLEEYVTCIFNLGSILYEKSKYKTAINYFKKFEDICIKNKWMDQTMYAYCCSNLSRCYYKISKFGEAKEYIEKALQIFSNNDLEDPLKDAKNLLKEIEGKLN